MDKQQINEIGMCGPRYEMFALLDALQETGYTNMFNAPRVLRDKFGITKIRSYEIFQEWTENFKAQDNS